MTLYSFFRSLLISCCLCSSSLAATFQLVETSPLVKGSSAAPILSTETAWLQLINDAEHSIDIGTLFFTSSPHSRMEKIVDALKSAARRGVLIRILVDETMRTQSEETLKNLENKNIETRFINFTSLARGVMHAKYMIVDEDTFFLGSQNFSWKALAENHETGILVNDSAMTKNLLTLFNLDWDLGDDTICSSGNASRESLALRLTCLQNKRRHHPLPAVVLENTALAFSPLKVLPKKSNLELPTLLRLIKGARDHIFIDVYEYSDLAGRGGRDRWMAIDNALLGAAKRGVSIHLMVSEAMLQKSVGLKGLARIASTSHIEIKLSHLKPLQSRGKRYTRVDHSKVMMVDDTISWIGTGNWEKGYFYHCRDLAIVLHDKTIHDELEQEFKARWEGDEVRALPL